MTGAGGPRRFSLVVTGTFPAMCMPITTVARTMTSSQTAATPQSICRWYRGPFHQEVDEDHP